jgi:hypothetical protein
VRAIAALGALEGVSVRCMRCYCGPRVAQQAVGEVTGEETGDGRRARLERDVRSKSGSLPLRRWRNGSTTSSGRWQESSAHKGVEGKDSLTFFLDENGNRRTMTGVCENSGWSARTVSKGRREALTKTAEETTTTSTCEEKEEEKRNSNAMHFHPPTRRPPTRQRPLSPSYEVILLAIIELPSSTSRSASHAQP